MRWALHVTLAARWLDPAETEAFSTPFMVMYALHDAMVKPMPGGLTTPSLAESWTEAKDHLVLHLRPAQGRPLPQRRAAHRGGREVLLGPLQGRERHAPQEQDPGRGDREPGHACASSCASRGPTSSPSTAPPRPARAGSCPRSTWRRWATTASRPRRSARGPLQGRLVQARRRAGARGLRRLLAQGALGEAPGHALDAGGGDAGRRPPRGRGGHRLSPDRAHRGLRPQAVGLPARRPAGQRGLLDRAARAVGSQVAVGRPARAAGRQPRHRSARRSTRRRCSASAGSPAT